MSFTTIVLYYFQTWNTSFVGISLQNDLSFVNYRLLIWFLQFFKQYSFRIVMSSLSHQLPNGFEIDGKSFHSGALGVFLVFKLDRTCWHIHCLLTYPRLKRLQCLGFQFKLRFWFLRLIEAKSNCASARAIFQLAKVPPCLWVFIRV